MNKIARIAVFALVMAGAVTASFSSTNKTVAVIGGDPTPLCDPSAPKCDGIPTSVKVQGGDPTPLCDPSAPKCDGIPTNVK